MKVAQSCPTLCDPLVCSPPGSSVHGGSPGKNTGVGLPNPESNSGLPHCRRILYHLSHQGSSVVNNPPANAGDKRDMGLIPKSRRSPGGGHGNPLQHSCRENPHGQRSLAGYSLWGHKELDTTEGLSTAHTHTHTHTNTSRIFFIYLSISGH